MIFAQDGFETSSKPWTESIFRERGVRAIVEKMEPGVIHYETLDGSHETLDFDLAMLLPPFRGVEKKAHGRDGEDITGGPFSPSRFLRVDADYETKPYEE